MSDYNQNIGNYKYVQQTSKLISKAGKRNILLYIYVYIQYYLHTYKWHSHIDLTVSNNLKIEDFTHFYILRTSRFSRPTKPGQLISSNKQYVCIHKKKKKQALSANKLKYYFHSLYNIYTYISWTKDPVKIYIQYYSQFKTRCTCALNELGLTISQ